jgi:predicted Zn finger-like uncharacterized protein
MKVTCQSCQAKYTIADEKVRGKVAKIRCKKCGTTIIVDGNDSATAASMAEPPASAPVADYTQQGASDEQWTVLVADGDQRTLTAAQVAELYASGTVGFETLVWRDGMADWTAITQVDPLRSLIENGPRPTMTPLEQAASMPSSAPPVAPVASEGLASRQPAAMAARAKAAEPVAARRPGRGGSTDLFGAAAQEDMLSSAAEGGANGADAGSDKLTGARNENSVLFSLSALTGGGPSTAPAPERDPASNKADLRALMGSGGGGPTKSKIDDIMNLSGGGVYSPGMMASPALAPPPIDMMAAAAPADSGGSKSKSLMMAIGGGVLVIGAVAIAFTTMSSKADSTDKPSAAASAAVETNTGAGRAANPSNAPNEGPTEPSGATREPVRQGETAKPEASSGESAPVAVAPGSPPPKPEGEKTERVERKTAAAPRAEKPAGPAAPAGLPPPPVAAPAAPAPAAPAAPAAGGSGDFDRAAALSALSAAATAAQSCRKPDGPTGSGRVAVTFANNGTATMANVEGPPFAGTPVGGCVAARFRSVHIPPFGGSVITVRKTFIIN